MVIFPQVGRKTSHLYGRLSHSNFPTTSLRNSGDRGTQLHTLSKFGDNGIRILITASVTTHKVSISSIARIVGCSLPSGPRACIRHVKQATHTKTRKGTVDLIYTRSQGTLHSVRHFVGHRVPRILRRPFRSRATHRTVKTRTDHPPGRPHPPHTSRSPQPSPGGTTPTATPGSPGPF